MATFVLAAALLTACASSGSSTSRQRGSQRGLESVSHATGDRRPCRSGDRPSELSVPTPTPLSVFLLGSGARTAILSNESDEDLCSWLGFAHTLVRSGLRVALYNYADDPVEDIVALTGFLRADGAGPLTLIGASEGAKASIVAAVRLNPPPDTIVSLSAEATLQGIAVEPSARRLHSQTLFITAAEDPYGASPASRRFAAAAPTAAKKLLVVPGTALLVDPNVAAAITAFLASHGH